jgi:hypothetical protein
VEGLASEQPLEGTLMFAPLLQRVLRYKLDFLADDGRRCSFRGQKDLVLTDLQRTLTTLPGTLHDGRTVLGDARVHFDVHRELGPLLRSLNIA